MTINRMKTKRFLNHLNLLAALPIILIALAGTALAQSTDLDNPTPMTTNETKGRWQTGKAISFFYSFTAGPGEIMVMFDFKPDSSLLNVSAEVTDVYGRGIGNLDDSQKRSELSYFATPEGERLVGRYELKRRQKLVARISIMGDEVATPGSYKVRVSGDGVSFNDNNTSTSNSSGNNSSTNNSGTMNNNNAGSNNVLSLPKSGKLRLVMDDGTIQEINLSRVREATIKP